MKGKESSRFFEHGIVELRHSDFSKRHVLLHLCMPNCLFQAITPTLLGSGVIDEFRVKTPIAAWIPQLSEERFTAHYVQQVAHLPQRSNLAIQQKVDELLRTFTDISQLVQFPGDLVPMLPLGTYVECSYRCELDAMLKILEGIEKTPSAGVNEFQWAISEVLSYALEDLTAWEAARNRLLQATAGKDQGK